MLMQAEEEGGTFRQPHIPPAENLLWRVGQTLSPPWDSEGGGMEATGEEENH